MKDKPAHRILSFPSSRLFTMDIGRIGMSRHHVKALVEADITESRKKLAIRKRKQGERISLTSWVLRCVGQAMSEHAQVHALKKGRRRLVVFDDADITIMVEKTVGGVPVPLPLVIRSVNRKSTAEIFAEIEEAKNRQAEDENDYIIRKERTNKGARFFAVLPQFLRLLAWRLILRNPFRVRELMGTAILTSVGAAGKADGWAIPYSIHPLCLAVGSITKRPGLAGKKTGVREYLKMTVLVDHDVVDGVPAARFVSRLTELLESGYGL